MRRDGGKETEGNRHRERGKGEKTREKRDEEGERKGCWGVGYWDVGGWCVCVCVSVLLVY